MALFENFPYTNLHELNLDWFINEIKKIESTQVLSVNGQTGEVILYQDAQMLLPSVPDNHWSIGRITDGTYRGIMFGNDDKAYIVHGNQMAQLYGVNNPPAYPVTSVNGQTGDIVLYATAAVQLPSLTDAQLHNWNIFRDLNGIMRGIQFDDSGKAYIIDGTNRFELYSENNPAHKDASVQLPGVSGATLDNWNIWRNLNNTASGIQFNDDGSVSVILGSNRYGIYTSNNPPPYPVTSVNGQTGAVSLNIPDAFVNDPSVSELIISEDIPDASVWALLRETENGYVGIAVNNGVNPGAYLQIGTGAGAQRIKLLTNDDIPSSSGVVSINGLTGAVTLTGAGIDVSGSDNRKINVVLSNLETDVNNIRAAFVFDENGNTTATHNIPAGNYVFWNNGAYKSLNAIAIGDTLSTTNLSPVPDGGLANDINTNILNTLRRTTLTLTRTNQSYVNDTNFNRLAAVKRSNILFLEVNLRIDSTAPSGVMADFVEIGRISGWSAGFTVYQDVPSQDAASTLEIRVSSSGVISISSDNLEPNAFYRTIITAC